jgi:hypothetical protein
VQFSACRAALTIAIDAGTDPTTITEDARAYIVKELTP